MNLAAKIPGKEAYMKYPENLKYTKDHAWVRDEGAGTVAIGITFFGQESMGEITFVELPEIDKEIDIEQIIFSIGSSKAFIDIPSPISGKVIMVNEELNTEPTLVNTSPYDQGWIVKMNLSQPAELDSLMDSSAYAAFVADTYGQ
jgi:glycine cleavage system H protein